ncbi:MAG: gliding motility protein GldN [Flavobacteriales bacterium]|jgi:gliding motility associated protien GldN|nr:gliding motility protein GldN [Flavobacteriales bacterium]
MFRQALGPNVFLLWCMFAGAACVAQDPLSPFSTDPHATCMIQAQLIPYPPIREADVMWERRVWRVIDAKDPTNALLLSPSFNSEGCYGLFDIIRSGLMNEVSIVAYDPGPKGEDDHFEKPFGQGEVRVLLSSTVVGQGPQVTRYMLKEDWIFDKQRGVMEVRIIGLAPMIEILGEDGEVRGHQPLFWLYYPECRLLLSRWLAFVEMQDDVRKSYEAVFAQRRFTSSIVKVSNAMVRGIDTYRTGLDALLESEGVREQFLQAGFDLWNY